MRGESLRLICVAVAVLGVCDGCPAASGSINPNLQCYEWFSSTSVTVDVRQPARGCALRKTLSLTKVVALEQLWFNEHPL